MTGSYFKMASRTLLANRGTTIINVLGLVIGIASALVIASVIRFEQSFDSFHSKRNETYRLVRITGSEDLEYRSGIPYPVPEAIKNEIPGIELTSMEYLGGSAIDVISDDGRTENKFVEADGLAAVEPAFFQVFDFAGRPLHWISGSPETSLSQPNNVVITKEIANKYFGNQDPIGKVLRFQKAIDMKVSGVIEDFPNNTDFPYKFMISYSTLKVVFGEQRIADWSSVNDTHQVFIYAPGKTKAELEQQFDVVHASHVSNDLSSARHYRLQEFDEVHYDPRFGNFSGRTITRETILALQIIVLFLLLAGCINYINLSTAQSTLRSKEIGLRKVLGSQQRHLVLQLLAETFVVVGVASIVAITLVTALMPSIRNVLDLKIDYNLTDPFILVSLSIVVVFVTLCSGLYPALMISRFNPIVALRSKFNNEKVGGINLRKVLVVAQFTITQILAVGTFIVVSQMNFFQNVDMGFNRKAVVVNISLLDNNPQHLRAMENELRSLPFVSSVSSSFTLPSGRDRNRSSRPIGPMSASSVQDYKNFEFFSIDENYLDLYQIKLIAGRNLNEGDTLREAIVNNILINESLMKNLDLASPEEAMGTEWKLGGGMKVEIVGIVNDFYSNSLKEGVDNTVMVYQPKAFRWLSVRLDLNSNESMPTVLKDLQNVWDKNFPEIVFQYKFFDDNIAAFYSQEAKYAKLFEIFSTIFIGIGCLGLYGLITFMANKKGKEIAIRKTLGATISNIIVMFSKEYVVMIGISFALAVPVVWYGVSEWLSSFTNHIELQWWMFAAPGVMVLILALMVVGSKSFNAARANPVEKLKYE
jgi:ABC-type antimicrobial peptide transport system permease subunit